MKKTLTEQQLKNIVMESVMNVLNEIDRPKYPERFPRYHKSKEEEDDIKNCWGYDHDEKMADLPYYPDDDDDEISGPLSVDDDEWEENPSIIVYDDDDWEHERKIDKMREDGEIRASDGPDENTSYIYLPAGRNNKEEIFKIMDSFICMNIGCKIIDSALNDEYWNSED